MVHGMHMHVPIHGACIDVLVLSLGGTVRCSDNGGMPALRIVVWQGGSISSTSVSHGSCQVYPKLVPSSRQYLGYEEFRPGQIDAILAVLHGHDVFVRIATGCMYLPPLCLGE